MPPRVKREPTPLGNGQEAVENEPHPDYLALSAEEQEQLDGLVQATQQMQDEVDKLAGAMGGPVYFLARLLLQHELARMTLRNRCEDLEARLRDLEARVS